MRCLKDRTTTGLIVITTVLLGLIIYDLSQSDAVNYVFDFYVTVLAAYTLLLG